MAYLFPVRPRECHTGLSRPHRHSWFLDFLRVDLWLGTVRARQSIQVDSSVCRTDRGRDHSRFLASHTGRSVVFSAVGATDLCCPRFRRIAHKPVQCASLFSIVATFVCCPSDHTYAAHNPCHSGDVLSAANPQLFRQVRGLTPMKGVKGKF